MHYMRWRQHGDPSISLRPPPGRTCAVIGCGKVIVGYGFCRLHYERWKKHGEPGGLELLVVKGRICSVDGCGKKSHARGLCQTHFVRWKKSGDPLVTSVIVGDDERRFWSHVSVEGDCWIFDMVNNKGYGQFAVKRKNRLAHRYAYELLKGPIPEGLQLDHLCRRTACVNPEHLDPVTSRENTLRSDAPSAWSARKTHCPHGHPYDEANTYHDGRGRQCRACKVEGTRRWRERQAARC